MQLSLRVTRYPAIAISVLLAAVFVYAGIDKLRDPLQFADSIAAFGILPTVLVSPFAQGLPIFEVLCALLLLLTTATRRVHSWSNAHHYDVLHSAGVRTTSRPHPRLRMLWRRRAVATEDVGGGRTGHRLFLAARCLFTFGNGR